MKLQTVVLFLSVFVICVLAWIVLNTSQNASQIAAWFDALIVAFSAFFWTLILLGLRAFFVRAYEVLK